MPQILTVATGQGLVTEAEAVIPEALYVYWPPGTVAHFWTEPRELGIWTVDVGMSPLGAVPGEAIAHLSALGLYNWPRRLDFVFRDRGTLKLTHVDILAGTARPLRTRDEDGELLLTDVQGQPFAHPNGSFYWTEFRYDSQAFYMVRWSPATQTHPTVLAIVDIGTGSGYDTPAECFYRAYAVMPSGDPTQAFTIDYETGEVGTISRSIFISHNRFTQQIPTFSAESADRWDFTDSGGAYGFYYFSGGRLRASYVIGSDNEHRVGASAVSGGSADTAIEPGLRRHVAMHFNAARTAITVYPYLGSGTSTDPYESKVFDPSQTSSGEINHNRNLGGAIVDPMLPGDFSTSPHQLWPWGPVE